MLLSETSFLTIKVNPAIAVVGSMLYPWNMSYPEIAKTLELCAVIARGAFTFRSDDSVPP